MVGNRWYTGPKTLPDNGEQATEKTLERELRKFKAD